MDRRPLVSVITPTWHRVDLLLETVANVRAQDYPNLEHVIVCDGIDLELEAALYPLLCEGLEAKALGQPHVPIVYAALGFNTTTLLPDSRSICPLMTGMLMARGEYQTWMADDERMLVPDHVSSLVSALEATDSDFAYPKVQMYWKDDPERSWTIGERRPRYGQITHTLYKRDLLKIFMPMPYLGDQASDWTVYSRWIAGGASWAFVPRVTFSHRADR